MQGIVDRQRAQYTLVALQITVASGEEEKINPKREREAFSFHSGDAMGLTA